MNPTTRNHHLEQMLVGALEAMTRNNPTPWAAMFTEDGVMEFPYAPPGFATRIEGKGNLVAYLDRLSALVKFSHVRPPVFHHSENVLVAEFSLDVEALPAGNAFQQHYISVIEHRGGQIVRYVDYWNPLVVQAALAGSVGV